MRSLPPISTVNQIVLADLRTSRGRFLIDLPIPAREDLRPEGFISGSIWLGEKMLTRRLRGLSSCIVICCVVAFATSARANSGTQIPLSQIQAGSEHTSPNIVLNPGFEQTTAGNPNNWLQAGNMRVAAPQNPPPNNPSAIGNLAAQALTNQPVATDPENYHYTTDGANRAIITFDQTKSYVLSGYLWNYGIPDPDPTDFNPSDLALVELDDINNSATNVNIATLRNGADGGDAMNGYFQYIQFNGSQFPNGAFLDVRGDLGDGFTGMRPDVYAQFDNIAITPSDQFVAPTLVPEPASLMLLAAAGALLRRRS
jgi:hypothetical protein